MKEDSRLWQQLEETDRKREKVETHSESGIHFPECDGREDQR